MGEIVVVLLCVIAFGGWEYWKLLRKLSAAQHSSLMWLEKFNDNDKQLADKSRELADLKAAIIAKAAQAKPERRPTYADIRRANDRFNQEQATQELDRERNTDSYAN